MTELIRNPPKELWDSLLRRPQIDDDIIAPKVSRILADIKIEGDKAVKKYALQFDGVQPDCLEIEKDTWASAAALLSDELKSAIDQSIKNVEIFHAAQIEERKFIESTPGVKCWRKSVAIEKTGLYIPGGSAPLISTLIMLAVPAKIAGCKEIIVCSPVSDRRALHPAILYIASKTGVSRLFGIGGVQAIGAMAYGTETIPVVYKIFGPGNQYVTCAKKLLSSEGIAVDLPAGPSELAVLADETCVPAYVAADLLSQAEHGPDSQVVVVSDRVSVINEIQQSVRDQLPKIPRRKIAELALKNSKFILVNDLEEGLDLLNYYAPEHLIIACRDNEIVAEMVINAGSVFLGNYSPESAGDYCSGTNHTLPTNGNARAYSGVSLDSFVKKITFQKLSYEGLSSLSKTIEDLAVAEELQAHANAVIIRNKKKNNGKI
jgi:histidinol dehydrogenase